MQYTKFIPTLAALCLMGTAPAWSAEWKSIGDLPNYKPVTDALFRGGQPSADGLQKLKDSGVKTIISLRNNRPLTTLEEAKVKSLGMNFVSIPMNGISQPSLKDINRFLSIVKDPKQCPVFVHCEEGVDRTGTMVALYRIDSEHWTASDAYREMVKNGFHPKYFWLADTTFDFEEAKGMPKSKDRPRGVKFLDTFGHPFGLFSSKHSFTKQMRVETSDGSYNLAPEATPVATPATTSTGANPDLLSKS